MATAETYKKLLSACQASWLSFQALQMTADLFGPSLVTAGAQVDPVFHETGVSDG